jgi:hypothetical protein
MTTTDRDELSAVQIARINRMELARFRKPQEVFDNVRPYREISASFFRIKPLKQTWVASWPALGLILGIWFIICATLILVQNHWSPGTQLYTRLPLNLDEQTPSITIYADQK